MRMIEGVDFVVRSVPFPNNGADGAIISHPDIAIICLNSNVCPARQRKALDHELKHLEHDDLYSDEDASLIEGRMYG